MFPFGRQQFRFELIPLLEAARADPRPPLIACSLRDILVEKKRPDRLARIVELVRRYFSVVLVHGDPRVVTLGRTFPPAGEIADRIAYTGFVVERPIATAGADRASGEVLVSAGGGAVGANLLLTAIEARPHSRYRDRVWRVITGTGMAEGDASRVRALAAGQEGIVIETFRPDFRQLLGQCAVSISQAGYNTLLELVAGATPGVVVPFATASENEQTLRARLFAERGLVQTLAENELSPVTLARLVDRARPPEVRDIDLDGADHSVRILAEHLDRAGIAR
jgi:predicted glycosyltransferase